MEIGDNDDIRMMYILYGGMPGLYELKFSKYSKKDVLATKEHRKPILLHR